jgi:hypothetical protein
MTSLYRPPEAGAQVRILPGARLSPADMRSHQPSMIGRASYAQQHVAASATDAPLDKYGGLG